MSIVNEVRNNGGRFVKQVDGASNIHSETMWMELGDKKAREKTSQALREGAPEAKNLLDFSNSFILGDIGTIPIIQPPAAAPLSSTELQHPLNNVNVVRNNGGRFVKQIDGTSTIHSETMWVELGDKEAREKTGQALREGAPEAKNLLDFSNSFILGDSSAIPIIQRAVTAPPSSTDQQQHPTSLLDQQLLQQTHTHSNKLIVSRVVSMEPSDGLSTAVGSNNNNEENFKSGHRGRLVSTESSSMMSMDSSSSSASSFGSVDSSSNDKNNKIDGNNFTEDEQLHFKKRRVSGPRIQVLKNRLEGC
jgi:hypothetical protein